MQYQEEYQERYRGLVERFDNVKLKLSEIKSEILTKQAKKEMIQHFLENLKKQDDLVTQFDEDICYSLVDFVTIYSKKDIRFIFKDMFTKFLILIFKHVENIQILSYTIRKC